MAFASPLPAAQRRERVERMLATLHHRGPDDAGVVDCPGVTLGFRRLSIVDLSPLGHQPMRSAEAQCTLVFNGEIYNHVELRRELERAGRRFRSRSDTEVLLQAYLHWGPGAVERLNGMWAFVVADGRRGVVFGSRDRFGIKPLYRWTGREGTLLASEIKAIRATGLVPLEIDAQVASDFLLDGRLEEGCRTFFRGIERIPAGHSFEIDAGGRYREWRYWDLGAAVEREQETPAERYAELFEDAIRLHMRSDVPVAVHLSGGLDSTSIACASARVRDAAGATEPLLAFSFSDREFDESRYIADTIARTGARLVPLDTSADRVWNDLPRVLACQDEPVHSATAVIGYQLMALTKAHGIRVILNGQGADETLGGYPSYFRDAWVSALQAGGLGAAWREVSLHAAAAGGSAMALFTSLMNHALRSRLRQFAAYRRLALAAYRRERTSWPWARPHLARQASGFPDAGLPGLRTALLHSVASTPLPLYLRVEDRNSMAHSIEARVPFLDHRLVEFAFSLPARWKLHGGLNKVLLREAMRDRIPASVADRREKMGFPVPVGRWLREDLYPEMHGLLLERGSEIAGDLDVEALLRCLEAHRRGEADHGHLLFRAAQFLLWRGHALATGSSPLPREAVPPSAVEHHA